jgi:hypothetical protein
MGEILLFHPLVILYVLYLLGALLAVNWPDTPKPPARKGSGPQGAGENNAGLEKRP